MIIVTLESLYYIVFIISVLCGAAFTLPGIRELRFLRNGSDFVR